MHRLLFVCHGNICRSPMAEFVMKDLVRKAGLDHSFAISSAATSAEEIGRPVYPPARRMLLSHGSIPPASVQSSSSRGITAAGTGSSAWMRPTAAA